MSAALFHFLPAITRDRLVPKTDDRLDREVFQAVGLDDVLADVRLADEHVVLIGVTGGPDGRDGLLIYPKPVSGELPDVLRYEAAAQTWLPVPNGPVPNGPDKPRRYIGWLNDSPPTPADLERRQTYGGYLVTDAQEQKWSVPIARSPTAVMGSLPVEFDCDASGLWQSVLKADFQWLWDLSAEVHDWWNPPAVKCSGCSEWNLDAGAEAKCRSCGAGPLPHDERQDRFTDTWLITSAVALLGLNYRLGKWEMSALRKAGCNVLDRQTVQLTLLALIDNEVVEDFKKKEPLTRSSPPPVTNLSKPGDAADCQVTE